MNPKLQQQTNRITLAHLQLLIGRTIQKVEITKVEDGMYVPTLSLDDGSFVQVWQDSEGNGPGRLGHYDGKTGNEISPSREVLDEALG